MGTPPDPDLTRQLEQLLLTEPPQQDWEWRQRFFAVVGGAALAIDAPNTALGPDGFGYVQLRLPPIDVPTKLYSIDELATWAADGGDGVVLRGRADRVIWVFTFGNIWARLSTGSFDPSPADDDQRPSRVGPGGEDVLVGSPSEGLLPPVARQVLRNALLAMGVTDPQVAAVQRPSGHPEWSLALTVPDDRDLAHRITWYLPPQMGLLGIDAVDPGVRQPL